jgi:alkanesulfonate monooxygenase SsuD/methylene tetrahydromethanopterin reductase-like flavin-dependent oxidoreductase (luciferase family)
MAIIAAQVDEMSDGRLIFGLGAGWYAREHEALGLDFPSVGVRFERLAEQLDVLHGLWSTPVGERYHHHGRHFSLVGAPGLPKPRRTPRPWLVIGGAGVTKTPALAARFADEFNVPPAHSPAATASLFALVDVACSAVGRSVRPLRSVVLTTFCGRTTAEVERRRRVAPLDYEHADLVGSPAQIAQGLAAYAEAGVERAYLRLLDLHDLDHIELLADALMRGAGAQDRRDPT